MSTRPSPPPPPPPQARPQPHSQQGQAQEHVLALKVLRTARPSLSPGAANAIELLPSLYPFVSGPAQAESESARGEGRGALRLPGSFGQLYLGESFECELVLSNDYLDRLTNSGVKACDVSLSIALSTPSLASRGAVMPLDDIEGGSSGGTSNASQAAGGSGAGTRLGDLARGQCASKRVKFEIKELGLHALVCTVTYRVAPQGGSNSNGGGSSGGGTSEPWRTMSFRKVYRFETANALAVRTKATSSHADESVVALEVQVANVTGVPLSLERVTLLPIQQQQQQHEGGRGGYARDIWSVNGLANEVAFGDGDGDDQSGETRTQQQQQQSVMLPGATRQYVFLLTDRRSLAARSALFGSHTSSSSAAGVSSGGEAGAAGARVVEPARTVVDALGRMDIAWRSAGGQEGKLMTSMLVRRVQVPAFSSSSSSAPPAQAQAPAGGGRGRGRGGKLKSLARLISLSPSQPAPSRAARGEAATSVDATYHVRLERRRHREHEHERQRRRDGERLYARVRSMPGDKTAKSFAATTTSRRPLSSLGGVVVVPSSDHAGAEAEDDRQKRATMLGSSLLELRPLESNERGDGGDDDDEAFELVVPVLDRHARLGEEREYEMAQLELLGNDNDVLSVLSLGTLWL